MSSFTYITQASSHTHRTSQYTKKQINKRPHILTLTSPSPSLTDGKYQALLDGRLLVHNVKAGDSYSTYRCRVLHTLTSATAASNIARIIVSGEFSNLGALGKDQKIACSVSLTSAITGSNVARIIVRALSFNFETLGCFKRLRFY